MTGAAATRNKLLDAAADVRDVALEQRDQHGVAASEVIVQRR